MYVQSLYMYGTLIFVPDLDLGASGLEPNASLKLRSNGAYSLMILRAYPINYDDRSHGS